MSEQNRQRQRAEVASEDDQHKDDGIFGSAGPHWILGYKFVQPAPPRGPFRALCGPCSAATRHVAVSVRRPGQLREFRSFASLPHGRFALTRGETYVA